MKGYSSINIFLFFERIALMTYLDTLAQQMSKRFLHKVFGLMAGALAITAATSFLLFSHQEIFIKIFNNQIMVIGLVIAQLGVVMALSAFINHMSSGAAYFWFFLYSVLVGISCSSILYIYTQQSLFFTFLVCAGTYATVAIYGYLTDADLSKWGNIATMGLFGLIIAMVANLFFASSQFDLILGFIGVAIFTILTAYDVQQIKQMSYQIVQNPDNENRYAVI